MSVRRVVTGHRDGKAVFASDEQVEPLTAALLPGFEFVNLWGADAAPTFPDDGSLPPHHTFFPAVGGFRFSIVTLPPTTGAEPDVDPEQGAAEVEAKLPGLLGYMEADVPGMHTTDTVDFEVMLAGEIVLELDDGAERTLRVGDVVVQNGTRHRWVNRGSEPATYAVFIVGAHRRADGA